MSTEQIEPFERRFTEKGIIAKPTGITGWGLYAERTFLPGEPIFWVNMLEEDRAAILLAHEAFGDCDERSATFFPDFSHCVSIEHPFWNVNHACNGNSGYANWGRAEDGKVPLVAFREIRRGEQITSDYSNFTTRRDGSPQGDPWEMRNCLCGAPNCRRTITGFHALPRELQLRAVLPETMPYGRVLAHILSDEPEIVEALKAYPVQYHAYLDALNQQHEFSEYLHRKYNGVARIRHG